MKYKNVETNNLPNEIESSLRDLENALKEKFPFGVPRNRIGEATGNILHPRTCANEDSLGIGIPERFRVGRNMVYPVSGVIRKLRMKIVPPTHFEDAVS